MNQSQLELLLSEYDSSVSSKFRGVYTVEDFVENYGLLIELEDENVFIINIESSEKDVSHWIYLNVILKENNCKVVYFDSFAMDSAFYSLSFSQLLLSLGEGRVDSSPYKVQGDDSKLCGLYCYYVAVSLNLFVNDLDMLIKSSFDEINLEKNDILLMRWVKSQPIYHLLGKLCEQNNCIKFSDLM